MDEMEVRCPAKVNLFLEILGKRKDGFHELETVFQPVALYDRLFFKKRRSGIQISCSDPRVASDSGNIVFKAVRLLAEKTGCAGGVEIRIEKDIPVGAGLGGGSSNAAAALCAVNRLWGSGLQERELLALSRALGADVPFFARLVSRRMRGLPGGTCIGRGRGEALTGIKNLPEVWAVLVYPGFSLSTGEVFGGIKLGLTGERRNLKMMVENIVSGNLRGVASCLYNRLEDTVFARKPVVGEIKSELLEAGARGAAMSGSGSAVFGLVPEKEEACSVAEKILAKRKGVRAYVRGTL